MHRSLGGEDVLAFMRGDEIDEFADGGPKAFDSSLGGFSQERFQLGEGVFDGIEVRAVGREVEELRARRFDQLAHPRTFVARQVVHDHDIAFAQFGDENFFDVGLEREAVDGPSITNGAMKPRSVNAPMNVVVFQWP